MVRMVECSLVYTYDRVADASYIYMRPFEPDSLARTGFADIRRATTLDSMLRILGGIQ